VDARLGSSLRQGRAGAPIASRTAVRDVVGSDPASQLEAELDADPGVALLQTLVAQFRSGRIVSALPLTTRVLLLAEGGHRFRELLASFWSSHRPQRFASVEAEEFAAFLRSKELETPFLDDALELDLASLELNTGRTPREQELAHDPTELLAALECGRLPTTASSRERS
jgi:hypothetical protein